MMMQSQPTVSRVPQQEERRVPMPSYQAGPAKHVLHRHRQMQLMQQAPNGMSAPITRQPSDESEDFANSSKQGNRPYRNDPYSARACQSPTPNSPSSPTGLSSYGTKAEHEEWNASAEHQPLPAPTSAMRPMPSVDQYDEAQHHGVLLDADEEMSGPPPGTVHAALWGRVTFYPYPKTSFTAPRPAAPQEDLVRVFIGQLPYFVTDMQLSWLCATFGDGSSVAFAERIMKRQPNGERLPTGCVHAYTTRQALDEMASAMHKRMLVDDSGVWQATTAAEFQAISAYVTGMKRHKEQRVANRPYDTMVVQLATSTYIPRHVASKPALRKSAVHAVADVVDMPRTAPVTVRRDHHQHQHQQPRPYPAATPVGQAVQQQHHRYQDAMQYPMQPQMAPQQQPVAPAAPQVMGYYNFAL